MQLGMIGLGKMGANMVRRIQRAGEQCIVWDRNPPKVAALAAIGARGADTVADLVRQLACPRHVWIMLPAGAPTESFVGDLAGMLDRGDVLIDGGNSYYKDDVRRAAELAPRGIDYVDVGTSGGVFGLDRGYCLMIGGKPEPVRRLAPIFQALAPGRGAVEPTPGRKGGSAEEGYLHCGPAGAGHFVKMIHNGIEYGLMQAYAEGLDILKNASSKSLAPEMRYELQLAEIAELWRRGSVVGSWLLDLTAAALTESPDLSSYSGHVADSGEGRWTVLAAIEESVPADVLTSALYTRFRSRQQSTFAEKVLSAMRHKFGGHVEPAKA